MAMTMQQALDIIEGRNNRGFMVHLEWARNGMLYSDYFPDKHAGDELIPTEKEAWLLASEFAQSTVGKAVNIYVVNADFTPVEGYREKYIENR